MGYRELGIRDWQIVLSMIFLVACICFLLGVHLTGVETEVMRDRFWKNAEPLFNGELPVMEYPPFALVFFAIPRFFGDTPWTYNIAYVAEVFVFMVIGLILVSKLAERMGHDQKKAMLVYSILMLVMIQLVADRYDIFPAILTLASFYLFVTKRYAWAGIILAVATLTKLYPAVVFPLYFLYLAYNRQWRDALSATIGFFGAGVLIVAVVWLIEPQMITNFMSYHTDRPLQIESVPSSILYLLSMLGLVDVEIQSFFNPGSFGSDNLIGPLPDAVAEIMMPLMIILILAVYALYAWARGRTSDEGLRLLGFAVVAALMLFMVANKVFSSQYLVWIAAPVAFLVASRSGRTERRMFWLTVLTLVLTQLNFAYNIGYLGGGENINDLGMMVILARNIAAIGVTCLAVAGMYRCVRPAEPSPDEACHARRTVIARRAR